MKPDFFKNALSSFTGDVAYAGAVRHLASKGMTLKEIMNNLTYPAPESKVREVLWKYYLDEKIICTDEPKKNTESKSVFVKVTGKYGKSSFVKKSSEEGQTLEKEYAVCKFGIYNYEEYEKNISLLDESDKDYIKGINWPGKTVYHIMDVRMSRIAEALNLDIVTV